MVWDFGSAREHDVQSATRRTKRSRVAANYPINWACSRIMEIYGVHRRHHGVSRAVDDQHQRLDRGQQVAQNWQLFWVSAYVAHRLGEALAFERLEIVFARRI